MKTLAIVAVLLFAVVAAPRTVTAGEEGTHITIKLEDQDLRDAIATLAQAGGLNVIVSPEVKGRITLSLTDTPVRAALKMIAESMGYALVEEAYGILRVVPANEAPGPTKARAARTSDEGRAAAEKLAEELAAVQEARATAQRWRAKLEAEKAAHAAQADGAVRRLAKAVERLEAQGKELDALRRTREAAGAEARRLQEQVAAARRAYDEARADERAPESVLQIHDVADLLKVHPELLLRARTVLPHADIEIKGQALLVHASLPEHARLAAVLGDLRAQAEGDYGPRRLRLAAARLAEARRLVGALKETDGGEEARNASKHLFELTTFHESLARQIAGREGQEPSDEQRARIRRLDEGTQRLLADLHERLGRAKAKAGAVLGPDGKPREVVIVRKATKDGTPASAGIGNPAQPGVTLFRMGDGKVLLRTEDGKPVRGVVVKKVDQDGRFEIEGLRLPAEGEWEAAAGKGLTWLRARQPGGAGAGTPEGGHPPVQVERRTATATKTVRKTATWENAAALKQRIERLQQAARLLQASGLGEEAERVQRAARETIEQLHRRGRAEAGGGGETLDAVNALRRDVHQLRGEVRELTHLVRQLLGTSR